MQTTGKQSAEAVYTIRVDRQLLADLHEFAESDHRSLAGYIRVIFERERESRRAELGAI